MSTATLHPPRGPLASILRYSDLATALTVVLVVVMMITPIPTQLLDIFIAINIAGALMIVVVSMYTKEALEFSAFPSVLLFTTLFRLAINVSVTRMILTHGDAGSVVESFGHFVVGGNVVVGIVVFLIIVVIQFVVITQGAGRVAEVAARFTLDAMPGKQMAIDADLNAGQITDDQARERRLKIQHEADFYGAMDGASKFVRGDAIAGVIIVVVNLLAGITVGVVQQGMEFSEAVSTFTLLTVGDGLAAQIPALLISTATGIVVTRAAGENDLGHDIAGQLLARSKPLFICGGVLIGLGLVPGLPHIPFLLIGGALVTVGIFVRNNQRDVSAFAVEEDRRQLEAAKPIAGSPESVRSALALDTLELEIGYGLISLVDESDGGELLTRVSLVRRQMAQDLGLVLAPIRICSAGNFRSRIGRCRLCPDGHEGDRPEPEPGRAIGGRLVARCECALLQRFQEQSGSRHEQLGRALDRMEDDGLLFFNHRAISGKPAFATRIRTDNSSRHRDTGHNGASGTQDCRLHTRYRRCRGQDHDCERADIVRHGGGWQHRQTVGRGNRDGYRKSECERRLECCDIPIVGEVHTTLPPRRRTPPATSARHRLP